MSIRDLAERWRVMKKSDVALCGEDMDALRTMDHEALVKLAWEALNTVESLETEGYDYLVGAIDDHCEGPGPGPSVVSKTACMWCIAQADGGDNAGGFNKWCKAIGGYAPESGPSGDALLYERWSDAKAAYDHMYKNDPACQQTYKIYPVVVVAGNEPRVTRPNGEKA
jgi:hypothetical protein